MFVGLRKSRDCVRGMALNHMLGMCGADVPCARVHRLHSAAVHPTHTQTNTVLIVAHIQRWKSNSPNFKLDEI